MHIGVRLNFDLVDTGVLISHRKPSVEQETSKVCQKGLVRRLGDQICTIVTVGLELAATACFSSAGCGYRRAMYRRMHWAKTNCVKRHTLQHVLFVPRCNLPTSMPFECVFIGS